MGGGPGLVCMSPAIRRRGGVKAGCSPLPLQKKGNGEEGSDGNIYIYI